MIHILEGPRGGGKTSLLRRLAGEWRELGAAVAGILSERVMDARGRTAGYDLLDLRTGLSRPLLRRVGPPAAQRIGAWVFDVAGLAAADAAIRGGPPGAILIVDECGPVELTGGGFRAALDAVLEDPRREVVIAVREGLAAAVIDALGRGRASAVHALGDPLTPERLTTAVSRSPRP